MKTHRNRSELISAQEIASWAYCPESWRLHYGMKLRPENQRALAAGTKHHAWKAAAETVAGGSIGLGRWLLVIAILGLLLWWLSR